MAAIRKATPNSTSLSCRPVWVVERPVIASSGAAYVRSFVTKMLGMAAIKALSAVLLSTLFTLAVAAQNNGSIGYKSQEAGDDGVPVLIKHLPGWDDARRPQAVFAHDAASLKVVLGDSPYLDLIDFSAGTEAVTAQYDAGKLLIIEFTSPQASLDADEKFSSAIATSGDKTTVYRRIGNYNVLAF